MIVHKILNVEKIEISKINYLEPSEGGECRTFRDITFYLGGEDCFKLRVENDDPIDYLPIKVYHYD